MSVWSDLKEDIGSSMIMRIMRLFIRWPILFLPVLIIWYWGYESINESLHLVSPKQAHLLYELRDLTKKPIKSIIIEPYDWPSPEHFKKEISKPIELKIIQGFLINSDTEPIVGGHVLTLYHCTLTFILLDGSKLKVLAEVCSDKPTDAYISDNFYIPGKGRWGMKPVFVPGLGKWLALQEPLGKVQ